MLGRLVIDLRALAANYAALQARVGAACRVAAVVKADAYGLGLRRCAAALAATGARDFFVATLPEALALRTVLGARAETIAVLGGYDPAQHAHYKDASIIPVLNTPSQARAIKDDLPVYLHFDTGMNRLGLRFEDTAPADFKHLNLKMIMSHFACADEDHDLNARQHERFQKIRAAFPGIPASLANSAGIFRSGDYHLDMVRPGMALYGLNPAPDTQNPMRPVVRLDVPVLQVRRVRAGESCGYGASYIFPHDTQVAIAALGYADGLLRALSNRGALYWRGGACPIRGRVSMDLTIVDLSGVPEHARPGEGDVLEVIGPHQSADDLAAAAGTIGYEILTSLGPRYVRVYVP